MDAEVMIRRNAPGAPGTFDRGAWIGWVARQIEHLPPDARSFVKLDPFETYGFTDVRHVAATNQDRLIVACSASPIRDENWFLAAAADGVGGSDHGELAASLALGALIIEVATSRTNELAPDVLRRGLNQAHLRVAGAYQKKSSTTAVALLVKGTSAALAWAGDSRAYVITNGTAIQVSQDDTLSAALDRSSARLVGQLSDEFAERLSQAIGGEMRFTPSVSPWAWSDAGCLLVTDGVWKPIDDRLGSIVAPCVDTSDLARRLLLSSDVLGGRDNATGVAMPSPDRLSEALLVEENRTPSGSCVVHLPGGTSIVVPSFVIPQEIATGEPLSRTDKAEREHPGETGQRGEKRKPRTAKTSRRGKKNAAQLVISEEPLNDPPAASEPVREDEPSS